MDTKEEIVLLERKLELLREIQTLESQRQQPVFPMYPTYPTYPTQPFTPWAQPHWYTTSDVTLTTSQEET